jgi:hypothetical protein
MSESVREELLKALEEKHSEGSFYTETSGGLKHFLSSDEKKVEGFYIGSIPYKEINFKVYMV